MEEQRLQRLLEEKKLKMQEQLEEKKLKMKEQKWKEEQQYCERTAVKIKMWGDALRNTITRMPNKSTEIVSWFVSVEKLFDQLKVPDELRSVLIS